MVVLSYPLIPLFPPMVAKETTENAYREPGERTPQRDLVLDVAGHWLGELMQALRYTEDFDKSPN
jgi:hypothetical protein